MTILSGPVSSKRDPEGFRHQPGMDCECEHHIKRDCSIYNRGHAAGHALGEKLERERIVAWTAQVVAAAGNGKAPWPIMKAILQKLHGEFERGDHIASGSHDAGGRG